MRKAILSVLAFFAVSGVMLLLVVQRLGQPVLLPEPAPEDIVYVEVTAEPTPEPTPTPEPEYFTISAVGDCTLSSHQYTDDFSKKMNGDYSYPFSNTVQYFQDDDLTLANLECTFTDKNLWCGETFYFRSPTEWANILVNGCVDFVTTANNHMLDFGEEGAQDTYAALEAVGMPYGKEDEAKIITTDSGLKVGIYCAFNGTAKFHPDPEKAEAAIQQLKADGAEYIICMFHWGIELHFTPEEWQTEIAHRCVDAGADLVYGSHPHVLEPIENYNGGVILYSMGNWSFGGNTDPTDWDTAIVQISVKRDIDGTVSNDSITAIPCCCSNSKESNDYCPTPYEEGTEAYDRIMSKLNGTYEGGNLEADYSSWYASHS